MSEPLRPVWLTEDLCGAIYNALAHSYPGTPEKANEFHARWKAAPADSVEIIALDLFADAFGERFDWNAIQDGTREAWRESARELLCLLGRPA